MDKTLFLIRCKINEFSLLIKYNKFLLSLLAALYGYAAIEPFYTDNFLLYYLHRNSHDFFIFYTLYLILYLIIIKNVFFDFSKIFVIINGHNYSDKKKKFLFNQNFVNIYKNSATISHYFKKTSRKYSISNINFLFGKFIKDAYVTFTQDNNHGYKFTNFFEYDKSTNTLNINLFKISKGYLSIKYALLKILDVFFKSFLYAFSLTSFFGIILNVPSPTLGVLSFFFFATSLFILIKHLVAGTDMSKNTKTYYASKISKIIN